MKRLTYILILSLIGFWACDDAEEESPTIDIAAPVSVIQLNTTSLSRHTIATGNALAEKIMEVTSPIGGKYKLKNHPSYKRPYKLGDRVKAGNVFVEIEDKEYVNGIDLKSKEMKPSIGRTRVSKAKIGL